MARISSVLVLTALYTVPYDPLPSFSSKLYFLIFFPLSLSR